MHLPREGDTWRGQAERGERRTAAGRRDTGRHATAKCVVNRRHHDDSLGGRRRCPRLLLRNSSDLAGSCHYVPGSRRRRTQRATRHGPPAVDDDGAFPGGAERALRAPGPPSHGGSQGQVAQQARPAACRKGQRCMVATAAAGAGGGELQGDGRAGRERCEAQPDTPAAVRLGRRQAEGDGATQTYLQHARPRHDDGQNQVRVREVR